MFIIRPCETDADSASAAQLAAELAAWDIAETQKLGIAADEVNQFYYPVETEALGSAIVAQGMTLLGFGDSAPAACIGYRELSPQICEMKRLFVRPAFRGTGLGKMMVSALVEHAAMAGYSRICLETAQFMKGAMRLYEGAGFEPCEPYYAIPETFRTISVFMKRDLGASRPNAAST
jgi:GNAT superfamily N-acetyltransferase